MRLLPIGLAVVVAVGASCGGGGSGGGGAAEKPKAARVDERKAEKEAKGLVTEIYETISRSSNTDSLMALLAEPLVVFGPRRTDAHGSRSDALVAMRAILDGLGKGVSPSVSSGDLEVVPSPGGLSAWCVDVIDVEGAPMALTAVLSNEDDFWVVVAAALARTPSEKSLKSQLAKDAIVPTGMPGFSKAADAADGAVDRFKRGLGDPSVWGEDLGKRSEAVVIGPSDGDVTRGKKAITKLWKSRGKVNTRYAPAGDLASGATTDKQLAWVTAPVVQFADGEEPLPMRLFAVFERDGSDWKMIVLQESLAVDEPGIGANFKKVTPPAVKAAEEPAPKPKAKDEKPKKKKKKKSSE
jgi:hypothetical protein